MSSLSKFFQETTYIMGLSKKGVKRFLPDHNACIMPRVLQTFISYGNRLPSSVLYIYLPSQWYKKENNLPHLHTISDVTSIGTGHVRKNVPHLTHMFH